MRFLRFLRRSGIVGPPVAAAYQAPFEGVLGEYLEFLREHRGLSDSTLWARRFWCARFLAFLATKLPDGDLQGVTPEMVDGFVLPRCRSLGRGSQHALVQAVRGLLRHLHQTRRLVRDLSGLAQAPRRYALATVPARLAPEDVQRLLRSADRSTHYGRRDYAILLLLAVYGLRAGEVARLRLDDFDWRHGTLRLARSKTGSPLVLPLTPMVGNAILAYLRRGRPASDCRAVFLLHRAPFTPLGGSSAVYRIVRHAFEKAGVVAPRRGPHVLRHALATRLVRRGTPLKTIADLLGHRHPDSSLIYTKVALEDLRTVALDVPAGIP